VFKLAETTNNSIGDRKLRRYIPALLLLIVLSITAITGLSAQSTIELEFVHIFGEVENEEEITDIRIAVIEGIIDDFEAQNPGITVRSRSISTNYIEVFDGALAAAQQGAAPHIVQVEEGLTQIAVDTGLFVPIGSIATDEQLLSLDDLLPQVRDYYTLGDEVWGIPWNTSNPILFYNKDMFRAAGLDPETPPRTFDDMREMCGVLMSADLNLSSCITWPMVAWFAEQWVVMQGGLLANNDNGRSARATEVYYNSTEMLRVVEWWQEMMGLGYFSYSGSRDNYRAELVPFGTKRVAMSISSSGALSNVVDLTSGGLFALDLGVGPLPIPDENATNGVTVGGASLWITDGHSDEELKAAADFIFFLTNTENDIRWYQGSGYFATRQSSVQQLEDMGWFEANPFYAVAINQLLGSQINIATAGPIIGPSAEVRSYLIDAFQSVIDGGEDPQAALNAAKQRADQELAAYNALFE
jgi:sn-glycerol 3-phosphate transport system substrate-binding protein